MYSKFRLNTHPRGSPLTLVDRDGSTLYENEGARLLFAIIEQNDVSMLDQYFSFVSRISLPWTSFVRGSVLDCGHLWKH